MLRTVSARLELEVLAPARLVFEVAVAGGVTFTESLTVRHDGVACDQRVLVDQHDTRAHQLDALPGLIELDYRAEIAGQAVVAGVSDIDRIRYLRPSRYCESDSLRPTAMAEFAGLAGLGLLHGVSSWVGRKLTYVPGSSLPTDGAVRTLLAREGVCRDYAHLVIALLRAMDVPARLASVYAPGLHPMDFHAVAEALVDDVWHVVDATALAPRQTLVRIATGRDAADTSFLTVIGGLVNLTALEVSAVVDELPRDDVRERAQLR